MIQFPEETAKRGRDLGLLQACEDGDLWRRNGGVDIWTRRSYEIRESLSASSTGCFQEANGREAFAPQVEEGAKTMKPARWSTAERKAAVLDVTPSDTPPKSAREAVCALQFVAESYWNDSDNAFRRTPMASEIAKDMDMDTATHRAIARNACIRLILVVRMMRQTKSAWVIVDARAGDGVGGGGTPAVTSRDWRRGGGVHQRRGGVGDVGEDEEAKHRRGHARAGDKLWRREGPRTEAELDRRRARCHSRR